MITPRVEIDGREVPYESLSMERSLGAAVGTFRVSYPLTPSVPLTPGGRAQLFVDSANGQRGQLLLTGWVDAVSVQSDQRTKRATLAGRDVTADLVDGYHMDSSSSWSGVSLSDLAAELGKPFGLTIQDLVGASEMRVARLSRQLGESSYATLERAARQFGVLIGTSAKGELVLGAESVGESEIALVTGPEGNVTSWTSTASHAERFGRTEVLGQNDGGFGPLLGQEAPRAIAIDREIRPERQKQFVAQGQVRREDCERLATWHVNMARARSSGLKVTLPSWRQTASGALWRPGLEVPVSITEVAEEGVLLTDRVELRFTESGAEEATISLIRKDSLLRDPSEGIANEGIGLAGLIS